MLEKLKLKLMWVMRRIFKRKKAGVLLIGYFNGNCPVCNEHIGIDIFKDKLTQENYAFCAHCNREIFDQLDKSKIMAYKEDKKRLS